MRYARNAAILAALMAAAPAFAQDQPAVEPQTGTEQAESAAAELGATASAAITGADGADHGTVTLTQTNSGVLISAQLTGLPPGPHGFHFHETGECEPPFQSAGGHFNPTNAKHGFLGEGGPHVGDVPNVTVSEAGDVAVEHLNAFVSLSPDSGNTLFDDDGTALVVHAGADDYRTDPTGESGDRIACGVVEQ